MLTVTSPFWLDWYFFIGGVGMAASSELRKEPPVKARQLHLGGPKVVAKRRSFRDEPLDSEVEPAT